MKNKIIFLLLFGFTNLQLLAQGEIKRLNFILLIDGEIPIASVFDGCFVIQDSTGKAINQVPFNYKVGGLEFNKDDFKKNSSLKHKNRLLMKFTFRHSKVPFSEHLYQNNVWLTKDFMIMHIYNKSKRENFEKYVFDNKDYIVKTSSWNTIMHYRTDWLQKHECELY